MCSSDLECKCQRIIVCNDEVAADNLRKTLLTQVAPPGVKSHVVPIDKAVRVYNNPTYANDTVLLLFTNPTDVVRLIDAGVNIKTINIGGMCFKEGKKQLTKAVSVNEEDVKAFRYLDSKGIELEIRKVASDSKINIMPLINKNFN